MRDSYISRQTCQYVVSGASGGGEMQTSYIPEFEKSRSRALYRVELVEFYVREKRIIRFPLMNLIVRKK